MTVLARPLPAWVRRLAAAVAGIWLHYVLVHALATGNIFARSFGWTEARDTSPTTYWLYVAAFGAAVVLVDGILILALMRRPR